MGINEIKLRKPLMVNGEEIKVLTYDVDELTINHITRAEACKSKLGGVATISVAQADFPLHVCIGMQAVMIVNPDIAEEDLMRLKGYDITQLAGVGTSFFVPPVATENNSEKPQEDTQNTTVAP